MPDNRSISQLTTAEQISLSDLFELSIPNGSLGYLSRKASLEAIANFIANNLNYSDLQTVAKTLIGAINEAAQSGGGGASIEEMTQAEYNALTPEQKADGTLRAISDAPTSINNIDDVNLSSPADGDALIYDSTSSKWVNKDNLYHAGDTISLSGLALSCYSTSARLDIYVPLPKDFDTSSVSLSISGTWRLIFIRNDTLEPIVVLNNAALSTIGTVSISKLTGGISIRVALNSGAIAAWGVGTIYGMGSNTLTFSSI